MLIGPRLLTPRDIDVLSERGGRGNKHPGTTRFRGICKSHKPEYKAIKGKGADADKQKNRIAKKIKAKLERKGVRFLKMNKRGLWELLPDKKVLDKVKQFLRTKPKQKSAGSVADGASVITAVPSFHNQNMQGPEAKKTNPTKDLLKRKLHSLNGRKAVHASLKDFKTFSIAIESAGAGAPPISQVDNLPVIADNNGSNANATSDSPAHQLRDLDKFIFATDLSGLGLDLQSFACQMLDLPSDYTGEVPTPANVEEMSLVTDPSFDADLFLQIMGPMGHRDEAKT